MLRAELSDKAGRIASGGNSLALGWLITFSGVMVLLAAAVIGLARMVPWWLSALIVGGAVTVVGIVLLAVGRSHLKARNLTPRESVASLRKDRNLIRERM